MNAVPETMTDQVYDGIEVTTVTKPRKPPTRKRPLTVEGEAMAAEILTLRDAVKAADRALQTSRRTGVLLAVGVAVAGFAAGAWW